MRFDLDEQQRAFQDAVVDYLRAECPMNRALEPHEHGQADFALWRGLMDLGIGGMVVPEEYGGLGLGLLDLAVVAEPVGRYAMPGPFFEHALATLAITIAASEEQKAKWLPALVTGELRATVALAEAKGEWTADTWTLEGEGQLTGRKQYVLHAEGADLIVVGLKGGALAVVQGDAGGIDRTDVPSTDAGRTLAHLEFNQVAIEHLPIKAGESVVDAGLILLAADAFGGASRAVNLAVEYSKEREQFGQVIGAFQAVKHQLADMALMVEPCVGLYWYAAHMFDTAPLGAHEAAALAKAHITEVYPKVTRRMIEAHGGIGYTWEYGAHIWLKRALFDQAYLGMPQSHRARVATMSGW
ncbi:acyl-CoA/acyl-ACP dehydrogenase [Pseudomonas sp. PDM24]|uniref:acyl-CoA dehydrogenase family protein n=1 Tax=Pseudomonas sp. PDM24 TaxID=2854777 RepID=UPI001C4771AA|nr:acyl-CoA dehydrogenase family protein [Pseudomonas sp. PDM24]MBV7495094.1 acyl-CoA/acyl-ACP dehydrogenase [Pseudomonas sp. PDM24]